MSTDTAAAARDLWTTRNNAGEGFAAGELEDTPATAAERENYEIVDDSDHDGCLVRDTAGRLVLICDVHGPWACFVDAEPEYGYASQQIPPRP